MGEIKTLTMSEESRLSPENIKWLVTVSKDNLSFPPTLTCQAGEAAAGDSVQVRPEARGKGRWVP